MKTVYKPTSCAICDTTENAKTIFDSNINDEDFTNKTYSARRLPDRRRFTWVICDSCGLYRSDPIAELDYGNLYENSTFDYGSEIEGLKKTYLRIFKRSNKKIEQSASILEVGGGNGFFLEALIDSGFKNITGIEPSIDAISRSRKDVRQNLILGLMNPELVLGKKFDLVVMFHVLDHLENPRATISDCANQLKPGGAFLVAVHNVRSLSSRIMRSRSPIIDVEHTYLYSKKTAKLLFEKAGLIDVRSSGYSNKYSLAYLVRLLPIPISIKRYILNSKPLGYILRITLTLPLGNIWVIGFMPEVDTSQ
jgi:SAM-dependent methyltransferase